MGPYHDATKICPTNIVMMVQAKDLCLASESAADLGLKLPLTSKAKEM